MHAILSILAGKVAAALASTALLLLFVSAEINSAPEVLPKFHELPQWLWTWQVHAARLFLNYRNPTPVQSATITDTRTHSVTAETTSIPNEPKKTL